MMKISKNQWKINGKSMKINENKWKCLILGFKWGFSPIFRKIPRLQTSLASRIFRVWENLNILGPSTLQELSIAHSFGVVPPTHPRAKLRERCRIFGIFGFGDLGTKKDLFFSTIIVKRLSPASESHSAPIANCLNFPFLHEFQWSKAPLGRQSKIIAGFSRGKNYNIPAAGLKKNKTI